jgi:hypothetical protein
MDTPGSKIAPRLEKSISSLAFRTGGYFHHQEVEYESDDIIAIDIGTHWKALE